MADPLEEAEALHARAQALRAAGDLPGAVAALEELCALRPEHPNALNLAGWLLATGLAQPERGIAFFQRAVALFPDELTPLANLVETLAKLGRAAEALEAVGPAVGKNPRWAEAWNLSGWL
jgi:tetratricopeptide (TPR) repeat protein